VPPGAPNNNHHLENATVPATYTNRLELPGGLVLEPGDAFRATGGPYYVKQTAGGRQRESLAARGPFVFHRAGTYRRRSWIEAWSAKDAAFVVLALTARRSILPGSIVARPYRVTKKLGVGRRSRKSA
jgi:hypothetical protein